MQKLSVVIVFVQRSFVRSPVFHSLPLLEIDKCLQRTTCRCNYNHLLTFSVLYFASPLLFLKNYNETLNQIIPATV